MGASVGALDGLDVGLIGDGVGEPVGFYMPEKKNVTICVAKQLVIITMQYTELI